MPQSLSIQVGKNGISENFFQTLKSYFNNHENVKIVFLKNFTRDREIIRKYAEEITNELGKNYTYRVLGFTIFIKKWRKNFNKYNHA
ncbi:MAG: hypothetical protein QW727_01645 [Candidatus Pacearchaeota archaeon]